MFSNFESNFLFFVGETGVTRDETEGKIFVMYCARHSKPTELF